LLYFTDEKDILYGKITYGIEDYGDFTDLDIIYYNNKEEN